MLWGAFNNSCSAMMAMSWDMGSISQNIANVNTNGYKRKETLFKTVMSESHASPSAFSGRLNVFGVQTADRTHIGVQGVVTPSSTGTDMAINGTGFFMVAPSDDGSAPSTASVDNPESVLYTRDGAFRFKVGPNDERYFTSGSGHYVLGYMADDDGLIQEGQLEPVYSMPQTTMLGKATTTGTIQANLPSEAQQTANSVTTTSTITDPLGASQTLSVNWQRVDGVTWTVTASVPAAVGTASLGPVTVTMDGWGNISSPTTLTQTATIDWDDAAYGAATASSTENVNLSDSKPSIDLEKISVEIFDEDGMSQVAIFGYEKATFLTAPTGTATSMWYIHPSSGQYATTGTTPTAATITFDSYGNVVDGGDVTADLSWTRNSTTTTASVNVDMSKMTQLNGGLNVVNVTQDGYADGDMLRSYFTEDGTFKGYFTNGETKSLFKIPIAQFISENNLEAISGTLFKRTSEAGDITVSMIEDAVGEPRFATSSIENSTVDIEDEFTKMIMTQKAYSTNATVFRTADEMTTVARDLKA
ncbi:flagellar hook-basal body complex protein [Magnetospirillum moscoviense]|nr:flagellar hook-basal body complex protein [Magnetospirillum moscoviense]